MTQISQEDLIRLKGKYSERYGLSMDEWTAIILHEIDDNVTSLKQENNIQLQQSIKQINDASEKIRGQVRQVYFNNKKEAFYYGLGKNLLYGITSIIAVCTCTYFHMTISEFESKKQLVETANGIEKYSRVLKYGETITKDGIEYLIATPMKGQEFEYARNYLYDRHKNRIMIPINSK